MFFLFCETYCQQFNMAKPNDLFDGEIEILRGFVNQLMQFRQKVFDDPENNVLMYFVTYEEDEI